MAPALACSRPNLERGAGSMLACQRNCEAAMTIYSRGLPLFVTIVTGFLLLTSLAIAQGSGTPTAPDIAAQLPRDLTPWGMFLSADIVVKAVMMGLVFASVVTWTICFAKVSELIAARRRLRTSIQELSEVRSLADRALASKKGNEAVRALIQAVETELHLSSDALDPVG